MAGDTKGFMGGSMKFGVGEELTSEEKTRGPLLPMRLLVVTDLVPRTPHNAGASAPEGVLRIDPDRFDDLFARIRPRVAAEIPSVLAEGRPVRVDLSPTSLKSFRPDGLCAEVPLLRSLLDGRMILERLRDAQLTPDQAHRELNRLWNGSPFVREVLGLLPTTPGAPKAVEPAPAAPVASETSLDSILDMVDMAGSVAPPPPAAIAPAAPPVAVSAALPNKFSDLIAQVARSGKAGAGVRPNEAIARVEKAIGVQIGAILQHPEVRRLEQAWRGLWLLTERGGRHTGIRIDVINARADETSQTLERGICGNASSETPVSCAIVDHTVDGTAIGFSTLEAIAQVAEACSVPVIVNGSHTLLGVPDLASIEKLDNKGALFESPKQAPWRAVSGKPGLRWVSIAINGVLSRGAYDKTTSRIREAAIRELPDDDGATVWIPPAYALGVLAMTSFRDTGWPCRIVGARSGGVVENLPVHHLKGGYEGEEGIAIPTEAFISTDTQRELARLGILALASAPNSDAVTVLSAPTAYVTPPKKTYDSASTEPEMRLDRVSLGDQLFVARVAHFLLALCSKLPSNSDPAEVQPVVEGGLWALFENAAPSSVEIAVKAMVEGHTTFVDVSVKPRRFLGVAVDQVALKLPLG